MDLRRVVVPTLAVAVALGGCAGSDGTDRADQVPDDPKLVLPFGETTTTTTPESVTAVALDLGAVAEFAPDRIALESAGEVIVADLVARGLTSLDGDGRVVADLARSWSVTDDGRTWTFELGRAEFSDGRAVTADDVVASVAAVAARGADSLLAPLFELIDHTEAGDLLVEAVAPDRVEVTTVRPVADLPGLLASPSLGVMPEGRATVGDDGAVVGSGAYALRVLVGGGLELTARDPDAGLSELVVPAADDPAVVSPRLTLVDEASAAGWERGRLIATGRGAVLVAMNLADPVLEDVRLRRAVVAALDPTELVSEVRGAVAPAEGLVPGRACPTCDADPARAAELVAEVVAEGGSVSVSLVAADAGGATPSPLVVAVVEALESVGFAVELEVLGDEELAAAVASGSASLFPYGWVPGAVSEPAWLWQLFTTGGPDNVFALTSPEVDGAVDELMAGTTTDAGEALVEIEALVPLAPVAELVTVVEVDDEVVGVELAPDGTLDLSDARLLD